MHDKSIYFAIYLELEMLRNEVNHFQPNFKSLQYFGLVKTSFFAITYVTFRELRLHPMISS